MGKKINNQSRKSYGVNPYKGQPIPRGVLERAIESTTSMQAASISIGVSYSTFKKYASMHDLWNPVLGKRKKGPYVGKSRWQGKRLLGTELQRTVMHKHISEGTLEQKCSFCGFNQYRQADLLTPLLPIFINHDENDHSTENVKLLCYNCYFIQYTAKGRKWAGTKIGAEATPSALDEKIKEVTKADKQAAQMGKSLSAIFKSNVVQ